jgi:hypothetical protein
MQRLFVKYVCACHKDPCTIQLHYLRLRTGAAAAEALKSYPDATFKSARHAVDHLKNWLNNVVYHSKKTEEAVK